MSDETSLNPQLFYDFLSLPFHKGKKGLKYSVNTPSFDDKIYKSKSYPKYIEADVGEQFNASPKCFLTGN
jgi:hypothetical protein